MSASEYQQASLPGIEELRRDLLLSVPAAGSARVLFLGSDTAPVTPVDAVVAIGAFDGFHTGHRHLIEQVLSDAKKQHTQAWAVTFDPDPDEVVGRGPAPKITSVQERIALLCASGLDGVLVVPFTRELAALDHAAFFCDVLGPWLNIAALHVGADFRLGAGGASDVSVLRSWGAPRGMAVYGHELVVAGDTVLSATRIRHALAAGKLTDVTSALGRRMSVRGVVEHGRGEGAGLGFPTANVGGLFGRALPADGVYAGYALVQNCVWPAAINVGLPPMYADQPGSAVLEAHLVGFEGDIYGQEISVVFIRRLRPPASFSSVDELIFTVQADIRSVEQELGSKGTMLS